MISLSKHWLPAVLALALVIGCASMQSRWTTVESANTIAAYQEFLERYPKSEYAAQARAKLECLYLAQAKNTNTVGAYQDFLSRYPRGENAAQARLALECLYFAEAINANTPSAYEGFLSRYPQGDFSDEAHLRMKLLSSGADARDADIPTPFRGTWVEPKTGSALVIVGNAVLWKRTDSFNQGREIFLSGRYQVAEDGTAITFGSRDVYGKGDYAWSGQEFSGPVDVKIRVEGGAIVLEKGEMKSQQLVPGLPESPSISIPPETQRYKRVR